MAYSTSSGKQMPVLIMCYWPHIKKQLAIYRVNLSELARQPHHKSLFKPGL